MISVELAHHLAGISLELRRQVGVLISRDGTVRNVIVGDSHKLEIPEVGRLRQGRARLRGLRLVHTHLQGEPLSPDDLTDLALLRLDLVAMIEVTSAGLGGRVELAHILPMSEAAPGDADPYRRVQAPDLGRLDFDPIATVRALEEEAALLTRGKGAEMHRERVLLIGVSPDESRYDETLELARSAGVEVAGTVRQKRLHPHPRSVVGVGKLAEIALEGMRRRAEAAIFDIDLKPAQARAFENDTGLRTVDRTQLILDIFAQRARSRDGKLQVELAQLKYALPRLTEMDSGLSRLTGGIGGRGPGETALELGKRRTFDRIRHLEQQVLQLSQRRKLKRRSRTRSEIPVISIIGYTNAGKSTLFNALTKGQVEAADKLFVTLDPTTRRLRFPQEGEVVLADTVGFLRDLPPDLVNAFRATLEELTSSDLLLHVLDGSDPAMETKLAKVEHLVQEMGLEEIPILRVLNKIDLVSEIQAGALARRLEAVPVSAVRQEGLEELVRKAETRLRTHVSKSALLVESPRFPGDCESPKR